MLSILLAAGAVVCSIQAIRAGRLLGSALWLAGASAFSAILLYHLGAHEVAVIELSVGAGLVTVLLVFAISLAGDDAWLARPVVPRLVAWVLVGASIALLGWLTLAGQGRPAAAQQPSFAITLWQVRGLDVLVQVALIFSGVLGVLALLAEAPAPAEQRAGAEAKAERPSISPIGPAPAPSPDGRQLAPPPPLEEAHT